jgi:hypothetical protein
MDHMTFMTIFSSLATVGMVLVIMWGMSPWTHRAKDPSNRRQAAHSVNDLVYRIRRVNRART